MGMEEAIKGNYAAYKQLIKDYKVCRHFDPKTDSEDNYDVIIIPAGVGYAHAKYRVIKNAPNLSQRALALIADRGNLCFGYRVEGNYIVVHTD